MSKLLKKKKGHLAQRAMAEKECLPIVKTGVKKINHSPRNFSFLFILRNHLMG